MPSITSRAGTNPSAAGSGSGNITQKKRSIKITTANLLAYPGNFNVLDMTFKLQNSTGNFTDVVKTLWAKE